MGLIFGNIGFNLILHYDATAIAECDNELPCHFRVRSQEPEKAPAPEHSTTVTITAGQCQSFRPSSQRLTMRNDVTTSAGNDTAAVMTHGLGSINASKRHAPNNAARGKIQASYTDGEALAKAASNIHKKISAPATNAAMKTPTILTIMAQLSLAPFHISASSRTRIKSGRWRERISWRWVKA